MSEESIDNTENKLEPLTLPEGPFKDVVIQYGNMYIKWDENSTKDDDNLALEFSYEVLSVPESFNTTPEELESSPDFVAYIKNFTLELIENYTADRVEKTEQTEEKNTSNNDK